MLAIDPGGTSGYVLAEFDENVEDSFERLDTIEVKDAGEWSGMVGMFDKFRRYFGEPLTLGLDACVVERYVIYPNRAQTHIGDDLYTAREIGKIEFVLYEDTRIDEVVFQAASQAKQRWPNDRLFKYYPGARHVSDHIRDAMRHLLTFVEAM